MGMQYKTGSQTAWPIELLNLLDIHVCVNYSPIDFDMKPQPEQKSSPLRGTLDLLILKALALEPLHGVGISQRIHQITNNELQVSYGSLFPALHRMEEKRWLASEWKSSDSNRRAKYYELTKAGRKQLAIEEREWERVVKAVTAALSVN